MQKWSSGMAYLRVKEHAENKGFTMSQVQRSTGLTTGLVRRYWHNQTTSIKLEALEKLATFLNVPENELIGNGPLPPTAQAARPGGSQHGKRQTSSRKDAKRS
jgi:transcriptional regulator with XRE-family HTH domain